jgi:hypothetical protein
MSYFEYKRTFPELHFQLLHSELQEIDYTCVRPQVTQKILSYFNTKKRGREDER